MQRAFAFPTRRFAAAAAATAAAEGRNQGAASQKAERNKPFAIWALWALFSLLVLASFLFFLLGWGNLICNSHESRLICGKSKRQEKKQGGGWKDKAAQLVQLFKMFLFRH